MQPDLLAFSGDTNISVGLRFPNGPLLKGLVVLRIGKPLMDSLSVVEFEAVLMHELSHRLVKAEFRFYSWLFDRSRISLLNKYTSMIFPVRYLLRQKYLREQPSWQKKRQPEERFCDAESIRVVGKLGFAMALVSCYRVKHVVSTYLPSHLLKCVRESDIVWGDYINRVDELVRQKLDGIEGLPQEVESMSHPSLIERLRQTSLSVGECGRRSIPVEESASFKLLESASVNVDQYLDRIFSVNAKRVWKEWHNYVCSSPLDENVLMGHVYEALVW